MSLPTDALRCPVTRARLRYVGRDRLQRLVAKPLEVSVAGAHLSEEAGLAYPFAEGIHRFLASEALPLRADAKPRESDRDDVQSWYDDFGWVRRESGGFEDSELFAASLEGARLYESLSHLALVDRLGEGDLLLDAGSGPLPHPEQLEYQRRFRHRVCVDFSGRALVEARAKLGDKGSYVQADLGRLPFRDGLFDGAICAYAIMHVRRELQGPVVEELVRAMRPGRHLLFTADNPRPRRRLHRMYRDLWRALTGIRRGSHATSRDRYARQSAAPELYFSPPDIPWWREQARRLGVRLRIESQRVFHVEEMELYFSESPRWARWFQWIERRFARPLAPIARYLLLDLVKPDGDRGA